MSPLFTTTFLAASIVRDREFGFQRKLLAAPVSLVLIVIGKYLGRMLRALLRQSIILILTGVSLPGGAILFCPVIDEHRPLSFNAYRVRRADRGRD
jgi:ABC-2 type transport system permease protein